jgi:rubrerythrin
MEFALKPRSLNMDRMASMELAINNEREEMAFYNNESARSKNPVAKALFKTLAEEEQEHMDRIAALHKKLTSAGSWPENVALEVSGTNVKKALSDFRRDLTSTQEHDDNDITALKKSIDSEAGASKLYAGLAAACTNKKEKTFFAFLSEIEHEHMMSLQDSLAYLEDPESWLEAQEHSGLDGA